MADQTVFDWAKQRHSGCCRCGKTVNTDGSAVTWVCAGCGKLVCRDDALTIPGSHPAEYYETTLCSYACWETVGRPDE